ncbi:hypothetical protein [Tessaracoccus flavescens]|uniref:Uncharacterized protein n=1 Tax=Tessaracoccus flavescens TaxID=399497 RepID=A0A1Q2D0Q3_9ACTN|nr:hypothetical protein [Tessaracoccus flavescens]AQP51875.1 hypothetical protein BW733_14625 [Tessaracoccus flavescens]
MGIFARLFSREETVMTVVEFDREAVRPHLNALIDALGQLADAMDDDAARMSNPGWRGRLKDLRNARGDLRLLTRRAEFSKDELFEVLTTVRPLYRGQPPKDFAHLASLNTVVVAEIEAVHLAAN